MLRLTVVLVLLLVTGCAAAPAPTASPCEALRPWEAAGFSGTIAIATDGRLDCAAGYGKADRDTGRPNTEDTVFEIGSVTKVFTAALILTLVDDGKLALSDQAGHHVPELSGPAANATIQQLLSHRSGLTGSHGNDSEPLSRAEAVAAISRLTLAFPPDEDYLYSNAGYTLLALIAEKHGGYRDVMASDIVGHASVAGGFWNGEPSAPGPRAVGYLDNGSPGERGDFAGPHWALDGNGGLAMSMPNLAAWTHALFTGSIVSKESTKAIAEAGWATIDKFGTPVLATAGGGGDTGQNVVVAWLPKTRRVVTMASNGPELTAEQLLEKVGKALVAGDQLPRPEAPTGNAPPAVAGTYELATGGRLEVTTKSGHPTVAATGEDAITALFPPSDEQTAAKYRAHEAQVVALLAGETQVGREEKAALEDSFGPITAKLAGTLTRDGETRTYVTLKAATGTHLGWYSLDEAGGISGAEAPTTAPTVRLEITGDQYRPAGSTAPTLSFATGNLTIAGPDKTVVAKQVS